MDLNRLAASFAPRVAAFVAVGVVATAGVTWAASRGVPQTSSTPSVTTTAPVAPLVVPDVTNQAFVFAKGTLEDAGFAWRVTGAVHGFAANTVVSQSPPAGTELLDTGAPWVTLTLKRNAAYAPTGEPEDTSPYTGTAVQPAAVDGATGPALPATTTGAASSTPPASPGKTSTTATTASTTTGTTTTASRNGDTAPSASKSAPGATSPKSSKTASASHAGWPKTRPPAFSVPGGKPEPLDEMPLPNRAAALARWLDAHPKRTGANVQHWLYQNNWIVAGAKLGWWHGAQALKTLVAVDKHADALWGIGLQSAAVAEQALSDVRTRARS
jgi:PASTA domain